MSESQRARTAVAHPARDFASPDAHYSVLEHAHPEAIVTWAAETIENLAVATSFQSSGLAILHLLRRIRPNVEVLFLSTGFHFPETLEFKDRITRMWDLNLIELRGEHGTPERQSQIHGPELYRSDPDTCCAINKVRPLQDALENYDGWISGLRRDQSPLRSATPIVEAQMLPSGKEILKIHPLAEWSRAEVGSYVADNGIPTHPLLERGYASIGCWPCTAVIGDGDDERAGRWNGTGKTECGIHTFGRGDGPVMTEAEQ